MRQTGGAIRPLSANKDAQPRRPSARTKVTVEHDLHKKSTYRVGQQQLASRPHAWL